MCDGLTDSRLLVSYVSGKKEQKSYIFFVYSFPSYGKLLVENQKKSLFVYQAHPLGVKLSDFKQKSANAEN